MDSAAGGLIEARDAETIAIFPIRGKMINLYKNSAEKICHNSNPVEKIFTYALNQLN